MSELFKILNVVKTGCVLAPILFEFFLLLFKHAFGTAEEGMYTAYTNQLQTVELLSFEFTNKSKKHYEKRHVVSRRCHSSSTKPITSLIFDGLVFQCMHIFPIHYQSKKTKVLATTLPNITINNFQLEVVYEFTYLGSTISSKLSLDKKIYR